MCLTKSSRSGRRPAGKSRFGSCDDLSSFVSVEGVSLVLWRFFCGSGGLGIVIKVGVAERALLLLVLGFDSS